MKELVDVSDAPQTALMDSGGSSVSHPAPTVWTEAPATNRLVCATATQDSWVNSAKKVSFILKRFNKGE